MPNDPIDLAEHRRRREQRQKKPREPAAHGPRFSSALLHRKEEKKPLPALGPGKVPCVRCHAPIPGRARRCRSCGLHFTGHAEDFAPKKRLPRWVQVLLVVIVLSLALAAATVDLDNFW